MPLPGLIQALLHPEIYPDGSRSIRLVETHISWVLLTGSYVYKIKKPVRFEFLDFTTLALRRHFCDEELRLNRRFAPQMYLEVVAIGGTPDRPTFGGSGAAIEYAVKMRQFDRGAGLDRLALDGRLDPIHIDRLADTIAEFHLGAAKLTDASVSGKCDRLQAAALGNFNELKAHSKPEGQRGRLAQLQEWTIQKIRDCGPFMHDRVQSGFIRECHGDLHLANIVVIDGQPVPFDCIEFSEKMRWIDIIDEVAFVVMDLDAHRYPEAGYRLLNRYLRITGDYPALALLDFYRVYRAIVRAKVALLNLNAAGDRDHNQALETKYRDYLAMAHAYTIRPPALLMITHGFSGSGKSTVAAGIAAKLPAIQLRSDVERKRLVAPDDGLKDATYSEETTRNTYNHLAKTASGLLDSGSSVIVDATFLRRCWRDQFRRLAEQFGVGFVILDMRASLEVLRERITERLLTNTDPSDADLMVLEHQQKHFDPLGQPEIRDSVPIETGKKIDFRALIDQLSRISNP